MKRSIFVLVLIFLLAMAASAFARTEGEYETALKLYYSGKYKEAVDYLREYVSTNPDPSAYYLIGYSLYKLGKFNEAAQYFEQAYLIDPNFSPEESGLSEKFPQGLPAPKHKKRASPAKKKSVGEAPKKEPGEQMTLATKQSGKQTPPKQNLANKMEKTAMPGPLKTSPAQASKQSSVADKKPQIQNQMNAGTKQNDKQAAALKKTAQSNQHSEAEKATAAAGLKKAQQEPAKQKPSSVSDKAATQTQKAATQIPGIQDKKTDAVNKTHAGVKTKAQQAKNAVSGIIPVMKDPMVIGSLAAAVAAVLLGTALILFIRKKRKARVSNRGTRVFDENEFE